MCQIQHFFHSSRTSSRIWIVFKLLFLKCMKPKFCLTLYQMTTFWAWLNWKHLQTTKSKVAKMRISLFDWVENTVGKGENAGYQNFLLFPQCFPKPSSLESLKVGIKWYRVKPVIDSVPNNPKVYQPLPAFSHVPIVFSTLSDREIIIHFQQYLICCLQIFSIWSHT